MLKVLLVLMFGAFVSQTTEYLPIGLLSFIARDLQVSEASVGLLVTGYAWIITLTVVPVTLLTQRIDRRTLFLFLLGVITLCNGLAWFTHAWWQLMVLRAIAALGHGVFWSSIASYAIKITPAMRPSRVTAIVFAGISLSIVAGVPLSSAIGQFWGWQQGFALFGLFGLLILIAGYFWLPSLQQSPQQTEQHSGQNPALWLAVVITLLLVTAHFTSYTYITTLLSGVLHTPVSAIALNLLVFGIAGACGTLIAGGVPLRPAHLALLGGLGILCSQLLILWALPATGFSWLVMAIWGASIAILIIGLQSWVIEVGGDRPEFASALYVMAFNVGIGSGAMAGGLWLEHGGPSLLLYSGSATALLGIGAWAYASTVRARRAVRCP